MPRRTPRWITILGAVAAVELLVAVVVAGNLQDDGEGAAPGPRIATASPGSAVSPTPSSSPSLSPSPSPSPAEPAYVNRKGGYGFDPPPRWDLRRSGTVTKLTNPATNVGIAIGLGGRGPASRSFGRLVDLLGEAYTDVALAERQTDVVRLAGRPTARLSGTGQTEDGLPLTFVAFTVKGVEETYTIVSFATSTLGDAVLEEKIAPVLDSFQILR